MASRVLRLQSLWPPAAESAFGAGLQIGVDVIDIKSEIGIVSEPLHDRGAATALAVPDDAPELLDIAGPVDERGRDGRTEPIGAVAMAAAGMITPVPVVGRSIGLAVDDPVELVGG